MIPKILGKWKTKSMKFVRYAVTKLAIVSTMEVDVVLAVVNSFADALWHSIGSIYHKLRYWRTQLSLNKFAYGFIWLSLIDHFRLSKPMHQCTCEEKCFKYEKPLCTITLETRGSSCKYCRYKKCIQLGGLVPKWVVAQYIPKVERKNKRKKIQDKKSSIKVTPVFILINVVKVCIAVLSKMYHSKYSFLDILAKRSWLCFK